MNKEKGIGNRGSLIIAKRGVVMIKTVNFRFCLLLYIVLYILHLKISLVNGSDDVWFADASNTAPFLEWITMRYTTWSGRIFPDTMLYLLLDEFLWVWRLLNPLFLILLAYSLVRVIKKDVSRIEMILAIIIFGYISNNILNSGFFWITGSMNYLWPIALGLFGMLPFVNHTFEHELTFTNKKFVLFVLLGLLATISNEQVGLCMSTFAFISIVVMIQRKNVDKRLLLYTVLIIIGTCIVIFAPGNKLRWISEVANWFPGYDDLTLKDRIHLGLIWLYKQLFIEMKNIILLLSLTTFIVLYNRKTKQNWIVYLFSFLLFIAISTVFLGQSELYHFDLIDNYRISHSLLHFWQIDSGFILAILPYVFWTIFGILLLYLVIMVSKHKFFTFLCLAAGLTTMIVMFFSPTIYASLTRPLVVGSVIISMVIFNVIHENNLLRNKMNLVMFCCLPLLTLIQLFIGW